MVMRAEAVQVDSRQNPYERLKELTAVTAWMQLV